MLLIFGSRSGNQRFDVEPLRLSKDRPSDVDRIVRRKFLDNFEWRIIAGSQLTCKSSASAKFNLLGKPTDYFAESPNLIFRIGAGNQDIGRVPQGSQTAFGSSLGNRVFQVGQKRLGFSHLTGSIELNNLHQNIQTNAAKLNHLWSQGVVKTARHRMLRLTRCKRMLTCSRGWLISK